MGNCCATKLVPSDAPKATSTFEFDNSKSRINGTCDVDLSKQVAKKAKRKEQKNCDNDESYEEKVDAKSNKKVARYKAKFDIRVTSKYDIKALIGCGSFSRVVRVENRMTKVPYAIKMVDKVNGKEVCESELNVLRRVKHAYIIRLIEIFETRDKVYMVMELATGGELFDRIIARGSFTELDAVGVLKMVIEGLEYLHGLGVTHRDLKPENLLYYHPGQDSKILITDFGLSAVRKATDGVMNTICGTAEYIAPEVLARRAYTSQVDMWAVGVITYILLSGSMPFDDDNIHSLYRAILKAKYNFDGESWADVSDMAKSFINRLLVLEASGRMTAAEALRHPWLRACSGSKNLYRTISKNLLDRQSTHNSGKSSARSQYSSRSNKSMRSENRRVVLKDVDQLHRDPDVCAELSSSSLGNQS